MKSRAFSSQLYIVLAIAVGLVALTGCVTTNKYQSSKARQHSVDSYVRLGMAYLKQGSRDAARRNFEKALVIDSDAATANNGLALLYQLNGEVALSEKYYLRAIQDDDDYTRARDNYGAFLYQQKRYQEAYDVFEKVTEDLSYEGRAYALANLGRTAFFHLINAHHRMHGHKATDNAAELIAQPLFGRVYQQRRRLKHQLFHRHKTGQPALINTAGKNLVDFALIEKHHTK